MFGPTFKSSFGPPRERMMGFVRVRYLYQLLVEPRQIWIRTGKRRKTEVKASRASA
jgi:hypothetical protein